MKNISLLLVVAFFLLLASCAPTPEGARIEIQDAWVRAAPAMLMGADASASHGGNTSAAYMTIRNVGREDDTLLSVESDVAEIVEMHTTQTKNGVSMMSAVDTISIPGRGKAELKPGGLHIMLIKIKHDLVAGEEASITLVFEKSGEVAVEAEIREP